MAAKTKFHVGDRVEILDKVPLRDTAPEVIGEQGIIRRVTSMDSGRTSYSVFLTTRKGDKDREGNWRNFHDEHLAPISGIDRLVCPKCEQQREPENFGTDYICVYCRGLA